MSSSLLENELASSKNSFLRSGDEWESLPGLDLDHEKEEDLKSDHYIIIIFNIYFQLTACYS